MNKKEEFRRYLEKTGVLDALTKVLVGLYEEPERPVHAVEYVRRYLGSAANNHTGVDMEGLQRENQELKVRLEKLQKQLAVQQQQHPYSAKAKPASTTVPASQQQQQQPSHPSSSATPASTNKTSSSSSNHTNNKSTNNPQTAASPASSSQQQQSASKK